MNKAVRAGYAPINPVRLLDKDERPKIQATEKRVLGGAEIELVLREAGDTFRPIIATMVFTGLRIAEVLGLRWEDIDRGRGYIHVRGQLTRSRERADHGKTAAARRSVVLIRELDSLLLEHRMRSPYKVATDFVFTSADGRARGHRTTSRGIERALARAGFDEGISSHNFRHTFASHMIVGMKEEAVTVSRMIGHKKPSFTQDVYSHLFDEAKHDDERRQRYSDGYGKHLRDVNGMSTEGRSVPQSGPLENPANVASIG
jgi:integrase